jgi:DNA-binding NarL/FixJ family response regulator
MRNPYTEANGWEDTLDTDSDAIIRILIADDQVLFAENLKLMLETVSHDLKVVGIAYNGEQAIELVDSLQPDLVLMDVRMPNTDGVEATRIIKESRPNQRIIMLTTFIDDSYVEAALNFGAEGYLLKNIRPEQLISAIRAVNAGSVLLSPMLVSRLMLKEEEEIDPEIASTQAVIAKMSNREKEILSLIAEGYSNRRIADELFISDPTVRNYISGIYAKLGSKDRLEVISLARKSIKTD